MLNGCNRALVIPEYDIEVKLKAGDNIIKFTPTQSGTFAYSCWMGMQTGRIEVVDDPANTATPRVASAETTLDETTPSEEYDYSGSMPCCNVDSFD